MNTIPNLMPDYWVNEKGTSQRVIAAIVKRVAAVTQEKACWAARCGASPRGCRGVIGTFAALGGS